MKYQDGNVYHIYDRGANKSDLFWCAKYYEFCIGLMKKNAEKLGVSLLAFCLMPNHYHLLMRQEKGTSFSKFLKDTFIAYTLFVNTRKVIVVRYFKIERNRDMSIPLIMRLLLFNIFI
jgi:putative transposase